MNEREFETWLGEKINEAVVDDEIGGWHAAQTFEECGVMTRNKGLVVRLEDGSEFQLQIVQSASADETDESEEQS